MTSPPATKDVIDFWRAPGRDTWFARDEAFDAAIRTRFLGVVEAASRQNRDIIGRFPHFNPAMGRKTMLQEWRFLDESGFKG